MPMPPDESLFHPPFSSPAGSIQLARENVVHHAARVANLEAARLEATHRRRTDDHHSLSQGDVLIDIDWLIHNTIRSPVITLYTIHRCCQMGLILVVGVERRIDVSIDSHLPYPHPRPSCYRIPYLLGGQLDQSSRLVLGHALGNDRDHL